MAFDLKKNKDLDATAINNFINTFTDAVESKDFEKDLRECLEYNSRTNGNLSFNIGTKYDGNQYCFFLYIGCDSITIFKYYFPSAVSGFKEDDADLERKQIKDKYLDAMHECWNVLRKRLYSLGLNICCLEPEWTIDYHDPKFEIMVMYDD